MKWVTATFVLLALFGLGANALFQNVPCSKTFDSGDVTLEIGQCVKTQSGWTVRLESAFYDPSSAAFKLFNQDGAEVTDKNLAIQSETKALVQEAAIELFGVTKPQGTLRVSAHIQSWNYLPGGESLQDYPQPQKSIPTANLKNEFTLPDGSQVILDAYKNNRMYFLIKKANSLQSTDLGIGQRFTDGLLELQFFGPRETVGGNTGYVVGLYAPPQKATATPEAATAKPTGLSTVTPKPTQSPSATPVTQPTQETPTATQSPPPQNGGLQGLIDAIAAFFRNLLGG
ncbi:hypothetical protein HY572_05985 [Candidatus Micrarchaeota archaeon]|nr:hypothetical protein [Candidatus Micrarchaeota archaeon]